MTLKDGTLGMLFNQHVYIDLTRFISRFWRRWISVPRYVCLECKKRRAGGYFTIKREKEEVSCPYCGSNKVKKLS